MIVSMYEGMSSAWNWILYILFVWASIIMYSHKLWFSNLDLSLWTGSSPTGALSSLTQGSCLQYAFFPAINPSF